MICLDKIIYNPFHSFNREEINKELNSKFSDNMWSCSVVNTIANPVYKWCKMSLNFKIKL